MFIAPLFTIAKTWKQTKYPSTDECIRKTWHMYPMQHYWAIKKKEIMSFAVRQMQLEMIIPSKSERQRQIPYDITYVWNLQYDRNDLIYETETESDIETDFWLPRGRAMGKEWNGVLDYQMQTSTPKVDKQQVSTVQPRELYSASCDKPEWKRAWKRIYVCVCL